MLTVGDISDQGKEHERPRQRIHERLPQLIPLEVLIADSLLIDPDALDRQQAVLVTQPPRVELVIRHGEVEDDANNHGQQPREQEDNLPRLDAAAV